jgi:circadian clock protein KaiC
VAAAKRGEKVVIYTFDESLPVLFARAAGLNLGLDRLVDDGLIKVVQIDPAELSAGELATRVRAAVEIDDVKMVYLDSLNGYLHAMGEERFVNLQLHEMLTYLNQQGIVTILVVTPAGLLGQMNSPLDVTYLADTVVTFRFFEVKGSVRKAVSVIKKRTGRHERTIHELFITSEGLKIGPALDDMHGVLTGVPVLSGKKPRSAKARRVHEKN